jgi:HTH-type transcriptional regulator/antitoxin HigA
MENEVKSYLGVTSLGERPAFAMAAKQTTYDQQLTPEQEVWLLRTKKLAETMVVPNYVPGKLSRLVDELRGLRRDPEDTRHVPKLLADVGVRFVIVERLPGLKIDGVCFWLSASRPVIGMSMRHDRIDNFWFVLRHEIEHVLRGHGKDGAIVDNNLDEASDVSEQEVIANTAAADFCVPKAEMDDFMTRKGPLFTDLNIRQFASTMGVHSGLVAGQLRKRLSKGPLGDQAWTLFTTHLVKVRHVITGTALVDGFGCIPQIG